MDSGDNKSFFQQKIAEQVWRETYKWETDETFEDTCKRVAKAVANIEHNNKKDWEERFFNLLLNKKYVPAGRIWSNAGTGLKKTTLINCFVSGFEGENQDSIDGIYKELNRQAKILSSEGGYGINFSVLRPRGSYVAGIGVETSGVIEFMNLWDTSSTSLTKGSGIKKETNKGKNKIRKGAMMGVLDIWHPSIKEFIVAKQQPGVLSKFNLSVGVSDEFMDSVKNNKPWNLEFPDTTFEKYDKEWNGDLKEWKSKSYPINVWETFENANQLWDLITKSTYNRNEPGIIFLDRYNEYNNLYYTEKIYATNPCLTGDTLVSVADGRNKVAIKQLAEEGKDVPVYCKDDNGDIAIRTMRNPRITGYNEDIYEVTLDDGSKIKCTKNHKFRMKDGSYKEAISLIEGDSLAVHSKWNTLRGAEHSDKEGYWMFSDGKKVVGEHRFLYEQMTGKKIPKGHVIHHRDFNASNNSIDNLELISEEKHRIIHDISGDKNPVRRFPECNWRNNPEAQKEMREKYHVGAKRSEITKKRIGNKTKERCKNQEYISKFSDAVKEGVRKNYSNFMKGIHSRSEKYLVKCQESTDLECFLDNTVVMVKKVCEHCGDNFTVNFGARERAYCSIKCSAYVTNKKRSEIRSKKIIENKSNFRNLIFDLFSKHVNENKEIPTKQEFLYSMNENGIKDIRNTGYSSYKSFISDICKNFNVKPCSTKSINENLENCRINLAEKLINNGMIYNHKIVSVIKIGKDIVYNGTVDEFHNFDIIFAEETTASGRAKLLSCNNLNCGEQGLPKNGSCVLGSINLTQYIKGSNWDYDKLKEDIPAIVRFQDNINDLTNFPLKEQEKEAQSKRRVGIGYMGYGSALYLLKQKYGSDEALKGTEKLLKFIVNNIYQASANLASEKGPFALFDCDKYLKSKFVQSALTIETSELIRKWGMRNSHLTTVAPTGNSSILIDVVSGGLEPVISPSYIRTVIMTDKPDGLSLPTIINWDLHTYEVANGWEWIKEGDDFILKKQFEETTYKIDKNRGLTREEKVYDYAVLNMKDFDEKADYAVNLFNLKVKDHVDTMKVFQKYVDSSISKTINLPNDYSFEDFKNVYTDAYDSGYIKGLTTYRWGTMASVISTSKDEKEKIKERKAPERPKTLPCHVYRITVKGEKWIVFVGLLDGHPYEVFAGKVDMVDLPASITEGSLLKQGKGVYSFEVDGSILIKNVIMIFTNDEQEALTRMISTNLRHGTPVEFIFEQLNKSKGTIADFNKAVTRALKKYLSQRELTEKCIECGSILTFVEGCKTCTSCGWGACG